MKSFDKTFFPCQQHSGGCVVNDVEAPPLADENEIEINWKNQTEV
jgi:hypothetical protein